MKRALLSFVPWLAAGVVHAQEVPEEFGNPWMSKLVELEPPSPVPWWPPAPGWYVVAVLLALAVLWLVWRGVRMWLSNGYRREAARVVRATQSMTPGAGLERIAVVLKRVAITTFGRATVAPLSGPDWVAFLDRTGGTTGFSKGPGEWLTARRYAAGGDPIPADQLQTLRKTSIRWIRAHRTLEKVRR